jgi:hypothetical protein
MRRCRSSGADLDAVPVVGSMGHLKRIGRLVLDRDPSAEQAPLS